MDGRERGECATLQPAVADDLALWDERLKFSFATTITIAIPLALQGFADFWACLLSLCVLYSFARLISFCRDTEGKISSYISVFIEDASTKVEISSRRWETRSSSLQLDKPSISEEFGACDGGYIRKGSELFMMALGYYVLRLRRAGVSLLPIPQGSASAEVDLLLTGVAVCTLLGLLVVVEQHSYNWQIVHWKLSAGNNRTSGSESARKGCVRALSSKLLEQGRSQWLQPKCWIETDGRSHVFEWSMGNWHVLARGPKAHGLFL